MICVLLCRFVFCLAIMLPLCLSFFIYSTALLYVFFLLFHLLPLFLSFFLSLYHSFVCLFFIFFCHTLHPINHGDSHQCMVFKFKVHLFFVMSILKVHNLHSIIPSPIITFSQPFIIFICWKLVSESSSKVFLQDALQGKVS